MKIVTGNMNTFDPIKHQYFINGRPVPGVTSVLRDLIPGWSASDWYLERGRIVHQCAAGIACGKRYDTGSQIDGQVAAITRFYAEVKPAVLDVEMPVYSMAHQYAGTLDLLTYKPGTDALMVLDFKSSLTLSVAYQTAAYAIAHPGRKDIRWGCGVGIRENGSYQMGEIYDLRKYQQDWLNLLGSYNVRRKCGIKEMEDAA
jgi:hypothetical protein